MRKRITVCDLCIDLGLDVIATHRYQAGDGELYDICPECLMKVKEIEHLEYWKLSR